MSMPYDIVTSADEGYSQFVRILAENCLHTFKKKLVVYDLGISEETKKTINADFIKFDTNKDYQSLNSKNSIRATHKPLCILDYFHKAQDKFLFIDADCLFTHAPHFPDSDICLTFRIYSEQTASDFSKNGIINSGVIFINPHSNTKADTELLIKDWISRCQNDPDSTDQKTLSDILQSLEQSVFPGAKLQYKHASISLLESEFYNDIKCRTGAVFHFKAASRREDKMKQYLLFSMLLKKIWPIIQIYTFTNRVHLSVKRKISPERYKNRYLSALKKIN